MSKRNAGKLDYRDPEWVAEQLGIDKNTVYRYLQEGVIPALQLGRKWLISESMLQEWLRQESRSQTQARREAATSADRTASRMTNLCPEAREVIRSAHAEARRYNHGYLGQEHLLLGLADQGDCRAARALSAAGVDAGRVREEFEARVAPGQGPTPRRLGRTPRARKAMRLAAEEAARAGSAHVSTAHLLLGILRSGEGMGMEMLRGLGVDADRLREQLAAQEENHP